MLMTDRPKIVLASGSKRRRELIQVFDASIDVIPSAVDEREPLVGEAPDAYILEMALSKSQDVAKSAGSNSIVIGADTAVVLNGRILGKPVDAADARWMLFQLRGRAHRVLTGITVIRKGSTAKASSVKSSDVFMRNYSDTEADAYITSGEPFDKAGSYAIQDPGFAPVERLDGCYLNVVGFPMCEVTRLLEEVGVKVSLRDDWSAPERCPVSCPVRTGSKMAVA
jgi:septum formation protein